MKRLQHRLFLEHLSTTSCLKKIFREKSLWRTNVLIKLQPSNTQSAISSKNGANVGPLCRSPKSFNVFTGRPP